MQQLPVIGLTKRRTASQSPKSIYPIYQNLYNLQMAGDLKSVEFVGSALDDLRDFPEDARRQAGFEIDRVQQGREPTDWRAMPDVGTGVSEIRLHEDGEHRVLYVAKFSEAIFVLHCFEKKTQKTAKRDIELAKQRYKSLTRNASWCCRCQERAAQNRSVAALREDLSSAVTPQMRCQGGFRVRL